MAVSHEDLAQLWGEDNISLADPATLSRLGLPKGAHEVLTEVGLPKNVEPLFESKSPSLIGSLGRTGRYCKVGSDYGTAICIETRTGEVVSISRGDEYPDRFVNSDIASFVEFMVLVTRERTSFPDLGGVEIEDAIRRLRVTLQSIDRRALDDPENWWSVIMEQMQDGLL